MAPGGGAGAAAPAGATYTTPAGLRAVTGTFR